MKKEWKWCFIFIFFVSNYNILLQIREVLSNGPIVLIPTHRSYVDFLIVSYVFFEFDLPLPRIAGFITIKNKKIKYFLKLEKIFLEFYLLIGFLDVLYVKIKKN